MTKILSCGDSHYGLGIDEDIEVAMDFITRRAEEIKPDLIVHTGDLYNKESTTDPRNVVKERVKKLAEIAEVAIIYGNHDKPGDLDIFSDLETKHKIRVIKQPYVMKRPGVNIYFIPWLSKSAWVERHITFKTPEEEDWEISKQLLMYLKGLKLKNPADHHIVVSHIGIQGAKAENNQLLIGEGITLGQFDLEEAGFDAGIFGHIHLRQQFANGNFYYNGSPAALDFGETLDKYFSVYNVEGKSIDWYPISGIKRINIEGEWREGKWIPAADTPENIKGSRVRVVFKIAANEDRELAKQTLRGIYEQFSPLELKLQPVVENQARTRAELVSKAKTLADKLKRFWEVTGTTPSEDEQKEIYKKLKRAEDQCSIGDSLFPM